MATKYNKTEIEALDRKMNDPAEVVICPRCGKELLFKDYGTSCEVKCETEGCLYGIIRGI